MSLWQSIPRSVTPRTEGNLWEINRLLGYRLRSHSENVRMTETALLVAVLHGHTPVILAEHLGFFASRRTTLLVWLSNAALTQHTLPQLVVDHKIWHPGSWL